MKHVNIKLSASESTEHIKKSLQEKGFTIFCDVDHQANAKSVDLEMPASRVLIFGNPIAGTKLMQKDIAMSLDLPLRLAVVDKGGQTLLLHQTTEDYCKNYQVENHPVLEKVETLFAALAAELN
ncbi:DUF302 domain-containing protein [Cardiobacterium sp. AH-315-I02]|nr:DUF302 domain-containing protein [Cardiobacterium sp. AH-315-I02]